MNLLSLITFVLAAASFSSITLAILAWQRRPFPGDTAFVMLSLASAVWSATYAMELAGPDVQSKIFWLNLKNMGILIIPISWLVFALNYSGNRKKLSKSGLLLLAVEPSVVLLFLWTNPYHELILRSTVVRDLGDYSVLVYKKSMGFYLHAIFSYLLVVAGFYFLLKPLPSSARSYRGQTVVLLLAALAPLAGSLFFVFETALDLTPFGFAVSTAAIGFGLLRYHLFNITPIGHEVILENLPEGVIVLDREATILSLNAAAAEMLALTGSALGEQVQRALPAEFSGLLGSGTLAASQHTVVLQPTDRDRRVFDLQISPLHDQKKRHQGWILIFRDITRRTELEAELAEHTARLELQGRRQSALLQTQLVINQTNDLNKVLRQIVEAIADQLPAHGGATIAIWDEQANQFSNYATTMPDRDLNRVLRQALKPDGVTQWIIQNKSIVVVEDTREDPFGEEKLLASVDVGAYIGIPLLVEDKVIGVLYTNERKANKYSSKDLNFLQALGYHAAIAIHKVQLFNRVQHQAITDELTRISNRRHLYAAGEREFNRAIRYHRPLSVLMLDIDHFKAVNDTHGHAVGDQVLQILAGRLQNQLRKFDLLGRYGGEEFVIVLPESTAEESQQVAERIRLMIKNEPVPTDVGPMPITISIGLAEINRMTRDFSDLVSQADDAMYRSKRSGRDRTTRSIAAENHA